MGSHIARIEAGGRYSMTIHVSLFICSRTMHDTWYVLLFMVHCTRKSLFTPILIVFGFIFIKFYMLSRKYTNYTKEHVIGANHMQELWWSRYILVCFLLVDLIDLNLHWMTFSLIYKLDLNYINIVALECTVMKFCPAQNLPLKNNASVTSPHKRVKRNLQAVEHILS